MAELKSAFESAWDRYLKGVSKPRKFNDVLANAAITETQFYARERLAKNLLESRAARLSSRFGHNGIIKGNPVGLMITASLPTTNGINKADAILQQRMARVAHSLPPINFFPPAVVQSKALLSKALRGMFHDEPSGVLDTDQIASDNILEEKLKRLDRIRAFGRATKASGFSRYAKAERESNERIDYERELEAEELHRRRMSDKSFEFEMLDKDEQFIQGAMRDNGWSREQAEQVYFKNLTENTKWLRLIGKNNPKIAKNLIPIAKAVGKAGSLPFIGGLVTNPALAAVGAAMFVSSEYSKAIKENLNWIDLISAGGGISGNALSAAAGGGLDYASALQLVHRSKRTTAKWKFGKGLDEIFRSTMYGADVSVFNPFATGEDRLRMIYNATKNIKDDGDRLAALEMWGASEEEYNYGRRLETPREQWSIEERISDRAKQWKDWRKWAKFHGTTWDKINAYTSPDWWIDFWSARREIGEDERKEFMSNLPFTLPFANTWGEVHETAAIDDKFRAGMFDNGVTNNKTDNGKSLTVINNWGGVSVEAKDAADFVDNLESTVGNKIIGSRYIAEAFDTRRIK